MRNAATSITEKRFEPLTTTTATRSPRKLAQVLSIYTIQWQRSFERIIEWERDPALLEDEDFEAPTKGVLVLAKTFIAAFERAGVPGPDVIIPTGDGGLVFRRRNDQMNQTIHFWPDQTVEQYAIKNGKMLLRQTLYGPPSD
jgi:hypothetical protein